MKQCRICKVEKPLTEFYKNAAMRSGYINNCKTCHNERSSEWRKENLERVKENSRKRAKDPAVKAARKRSMQSAEAKARAREAVRRYRERKPMVDVAHRFIRLAVAKGILKRESECSVCSSSDRVEAHHDDYTKPEVVRWLCKSCHEEWHRTNKPIYTNEDKEAA